MIAMTRLSLAMFTFVGPVLAAVAPAAAPAPQPAPRQGLRLPDMPIHDPWILAHEESKTYYNLKVVRVREDLHGRPATP